MNITKLDTAFKKRIMDKRKGWKFMFQKEELMRLTVEKDGWEEK